MGFKLLNFHTALFLALMGFTSIGESFAADPIQTLDSLIKDTQKIVSTMDSDLALRAVQDLAQHNIQINAKLKELQESVTIAKHICQDTLNRQPNPALIFKIL